MISIITATFNAQDLISNLIISLSNQTDNRFEWIVVDGKSTDNTINILRNVRDIDITFISEKDNGIYDAINKGIKLAKYDYYLVCGSDDYLFSQTIENFNILLCKPSYYDFYATSFKINNKIFYPVKNLSWLYGMRGMSSCHSVALLINKKLHCQFGYYDLLFPIFADQLFVQNAVINGSSIMHCKYIISGIYSTNGMSSKDSFDKQYEFFKMQLFLNRNFFIQYILYFTRILKFKLCKKY